MNPISIGEKLYSFAQGAKELNLFDEESQGVKKVKTEDLIKKYESGDKATVELFESWVDGKSSVLLEISKEESETIKFVSDLQSENENLKEEIKHFTTLYESHKSSSEHYEKENEALKAEVEKLKATKPEKVTDLEKENEALKAELEKLKAKPEKAETAKADSKKEGGV